jgi:hypothetical protein
MALGIAASPSSSLFRIGWPPDPLAWPPPQYRGVGRFDDPQNEFGVLYVAESLRACYLETLDTFRPDRALLQRLLAMGPETFVPQSGLVPDTYFDRLIASLRLEPGQRWLDVRIGAPETVVALSREPAIAAMLPELGYGKRVKPGDLVGSDRRLTRKVARWAYERGYAGLAYSCSHDLRLDCWAVFEGAAFSVVGPPSPIDPTNPDFIAVARQFELTISFAGRG